VPENSGPEYEESSRVFALDVLGYPRGGTSRYEEHRRTKALVGSHRSPTRQRVACLPPPGTE
jgi:hypothetical protein